MFFRKQNTRIFRRNFIDILLKLFSGEGFIPRAQCGLWTTEMLRLHNISDFLIWTAYLAIPAVLIKFAYSRRRELPFASCSGYSACSFWRAEPRI